MYNCFLSTLDVSMQDNSVDIEHDYLYTQPVDPIIKDEDNNTPVRQNADHCDVTNQIPSVDINNNNASVHDEPQNQDDRITKNTKGPEHEKTARNSNKHGIEASNCLQHSCSQYPLSLILPQEPNCDEIPSSEFQLGRFILFENKYGTERGDLCSTLTL